MFRVEFACLCGFSFQEDFLETEVIKAADLENFYIRCPRCGEEAYPRSFAPAKEKSWRRQDWS